MNEIFLNYPNAKGFFYVATPNEKCKPIAPKQDVVSDQVAETPTLEMVLSNFIKNLTSKTKSKTNGK